MTSTRFFTTHHLFADFPSASSLKNLPHRRFAYRGDAAFIRLSTTLRQL
jgi:hypothetical protein